MEFARSKKGIIVFQRKYILDLLEEIGMGGCRLADTPILDITLSVSVLSQFMHSPYEEHLEAVYQILRYLKSNPRKSLYFKKTNDREASIFTYVEWVGSVTDRKSATGYCAYVWENLVTWRNKKQGFFCSKQCRSRIQSNGSRNLSITVALLELAALIELVVLP
ncbi:secreted RxLR effector protein 161-like [Cicer arietinum]|uniref:secreted RxLR effector protein 161-like n=1 Tax=Cicer arietinum TaxID=3827 RepID=UPI003CC5CD5E